MTPHEYLNTFTNYEQHLQKLKVYDFDLTRVNELLNLLGNPQDDLKIIHVAGTKGKGSTCAFMTQILTEAGYRVGLYTSPHLHVVNERIRIGVTMISDEELEIMINAIRPQIASLLNRGMFLTYFEVLTVIALYYFKKQNLDFVILETGLGGRLDATNSVESLIAVLTPISLDHTKILGDSVAKITQEKAGIIKNSRQRVVIGIQESEAMDVILKRCREFGIPPIMVFPEEKLSCELSLKGEHQKQNALTALKVIELLKQWGYKISDEAIVQGFKLTVWPGRFEAIRQNPSIVVDGAHNEASARALAKTIAQEYPAKKIILVLGLSVDKDIKAIVSILKDVAGTIILTKADHPRAFEFNKSVAVQLLKAKDWYITANVKEALDMALAKASSQDVIVVTGSLFIVAQVKEAMSLRTK